MEIENRKGNKTSARGAIYSEWAKRCINVKGKMCRELKRKYKLSEENITTAIDTVKQRMQVKVQRMRRYVKRGKFYHQNFIFEK